MKYAFGCMGSSETVLSKMMKFRAGDLDGVLGRISNSYHRRRVGPKI